MREASSTAVAASFRWLDSSSPSTKPAHMSAMNALDSSSDNNSVLTK
ncbi:MAG: hypothetical protein VB067_09380 [Christensenellaceae bacterium]|nr:hypothetical protein [Christensenellaceae bacterium]MEA5066145.1 hypothetical protein [Eubacteriales bacterium]MEA5069186.1 hypothetical protein [Christensenellaceae bacterium]